MLTSNEVRRLNEPMQQAEALLELMREFRKTAPTVSLKMFTNYAERELACGRFVTRLGATVEQKCELWRAVRGLLDFAVMGAVILIGVAADEILKRDFSRRPRPSLFLVIPRRDPGPARQQRLDRRKAAARETEDGIMFVGEGPGGDHRSLRVLKPASARMKLMIQKRITTVGSLQPKCSK